jgi:hypothetical protein
MVCIPSVRRELHLASAELRKCYQNHVHETTLTGKRLADFLASLEEHETVLMQRLRDLEAQDVRSLLGGYQLKQPEKEWASSEEEECIG